jgi:hypothetical protein
MTDERQPEQSLADLVAAAIAPLLIMALIGSLVFFLIEVLYIGQYYGRLQWFFFFFVFGSVLVARIGMRGDIGSRAGMYSLVLGLLMWAALTLYVEFPRQSSTAQLGWAIHLALIFLIWWSAQRLTRDSTLDANTTDASGKGLLDAAGLDRPGPKPETEAEAEPSKKKKKERRKNRGGMIAWWERYQKYREEKKQRPRTHGVWVVYFSLAALPLFGLGQVLIPSADTGRRQYAFWLMCIYVASGLGLLLTTSFLSLRRYLRQKKLQMPAAITTTWLFFGTALIVGLLVLGALMPRPSPEYSLTERFFQFGSQKQDASQFAANGNEPGEGEGAAGKADGQNQPDKTGNQGQGNKASGKGPGNDKNGSQAKGGTSSGKADNSGNKSEQGNQQQQNQKADADAKKEQGAGKQPQNSTPPKSLLNNTSFEWLKPVLEVLKWVVLGAVVLLVAFLGLRALLKFLANFTLWASNLLNMLNAWWQALWAREKSTRPQATDAKTEAIRHRPFSFFRDPFQSGAYRQMAEAELIRYSFAALEAWARERDLARPGGETPLEFVRRVSEEYPAFEEDVRTLAEWYATAAYAPDRVDTACFDDLRRFWRVLRDVTERPLSAGTLSES